MCYDKAGRIVLLKTESRNRELLFAEGYVYGADGKRSAKVTSAGEVTLYEYDSQGRLSIVWNPATAEMEKLLTEEAEENELPTLKELKENKYLSGSIQNDLSVLVYRMNSPARITPMQLFIKEQYSYDGNGNRITKTTAHGTIKYWYDEENRLLATGTNGIQNVTYAYDRNGNLLKKESKLKVTTYVYNSENRIVYSEVRDIIKKTRTVTNYAYDALGRRLIVQDNGGTALRSVYDAFTFDVLKEAPTYENGLFTDTGSAGIKFGRTGKPTGERYRYLDEDHKDGNRDYYLEEGKWKNVSSRYTGTRNVLSANSEVVSQYKDSGSEYFIVDEFGSVKGTSDGYGNLNVTYSYDAFGTLVSDDSSVSYGYAGKSYDPATGLYNFGYRDYLPISARFTTVDPIRDGHNWFTYCNGDPVNFVDLLGLCKENDRYTDNIKQYRIPDGNGSRIQKTRAKTTGIVIHYTDGSKFDKNGKEIASTPIETIDDWIEREDTNAHFVVGDNGDIYQALPKDEIGQHAGKNVQDGMKKKLKGNPNERTIGIEMENYNKKGAITEATKKATVQLTAELCIEYGIDPQTGIYRHYDITNKPCPLNFVDNPGDWQQFKNDVEKEMENLGAVGYR